MNWVLLSFLGSIGAIVVAVCVVALFVRHRINLHHRVDAKVATPAPITWLADPRAPARLHRRLAKVGRASTAVANDHRITRKRLRRPIEQPPLVGVADDLRQQAVRLDHEVARLALLSPSAKRAPLHQLTVAVAEVEGACARLISLSAEVRTPPVLATDDADITSIAAQVERLAEAHRVLLQIDAASGLAPQPTRTMPATVPGR